MSNDDGSASWTMHSTAPRVEPGEASLSIVGERYERQRELGRGGHGVVQLCRDQIIRREIAIKTRFGGRRLARFIREARIQGQLEHPGIVPVYDLGTDDGGHVYFSMKCLRGRTLRHIISDLVAGDPAAEAAFPRSRLIQIFLSVCNALHYAHSRGVVHRDVKPANIMVGNYGEVYLLDWGVATMLEPDDVETTGGHGDKKADAPLVDDQELAKELTADGTIVGTVGYLSPEQALGHRAEIDTRSDVYSLGAILFELLTLQRLHLDGNRNAILYSTIKGTSCADARERSPERDIPPELAQVCMKATANDKAERYASVRDVADAVERYLEGDRDLERRRQLAQEHARRAEDLADKAISASTGAVDARRESLREVARAIALDPEHAQARRILYRIMTTPPKTLPEDAQRDMRRAKDRKDQTRLKAAEIAVPSAFAVLLGGMFWMGVRDPRVPLVLLVSLAASLALSPLIRTRRISAHFAYLDITLQLLATACLGRMFGPLVVMPAFLTVSACAMGLVGRRDLRLFGLFGGLLTLVGSVGLEYAGILEPSYRFVESGVQIIPTAIALPADVTPVVLVAAAIVTIVLPWAAISRFRHRITVLQNEASLHNWHLSQLLPDAGSEGSASSGS